MYFTDFNQGENILFVFILGINDNNNSILPGPIQIQTFPPNLQTPTTMEQVNGTTPSNQVHIPNLVQVVQFSPAVDHMPEVITLV